MVGEGNDRKALLAEIGERRLEQVIHFAGAVDQAELPAIFASIDVFLFTSKIRGVDTLGLVAIEAMACGTPVVALDTEVTREYLSPGINGEFAGRDDPQSFVEAVLQVRTWYRGDQGSRDQVADSVSDFDADRVSALLSARLSALIQTR